MSHAQQPEASQRGTLPTNADIDALVYELRQTGTDSTYEVVRAAISRWAAPSAQAVEPAADAVQSGTITYTDGTTATGPGSLPQVSPRQQRAAALIDSVEALLGGANGPTIQLRALLAAPATAAVAVPEPEAWRYTDARGHYRYRGMRPGFAVEYPMLKPEPLFTMQQVSAMLAATPPAPAAVAVPVPPLTPDEARQAARTARLMSGPSDATQPTEYAMAGALALAAKLAATPQALALKAAPPCNP